MILVVTVSDDIHAHAVRDAVRRHSDISCHIIECDRVHTSFPLHWSRTTAGYDARLVGDLGELIDPKLGRIIWWRRPGADQRFDNEVWTDLHARLINANCRSALNGVLASSFSGKWISLPTADMQAGNKIFQLMIASNCGFRVPQTLVSQSFEDVCRFYRLFKHGIIVKPVVNVAEPLTFTQLIKTMDSVDPDSIKICPAIYQEFILGNRHVRLNCFGNRSYAAIIESDYLDWRVNLTVPIRSWIVPDELHCRVRHVLDTLGLEMGIVDLKETPEGEFVWLEVNPQGQFLFLEGLTKEPMADRFAEYLLAEVEN